MITRCRNCGKLITALKKVLNSGYCDKCASDRAIIVAEQLVDAMVEAERERKRR